uniref:Uncharacterized protein n=1 Tax=Timema douglasi TaxID=61478 RepID=A0A7R8Z4E2_TIMDO|nr:unnamed protein product [Timema douglasi]
MNIDAKPSVDTKDNICDEIHSIAALPFEYVDVPIIKQEVEYTGTRTKCKEKNCAKYAQGGGYCMKHGGTQAKCKEESCTKYAQGVVTRTRIKINSDRMKPQYDLRENDRNFSAGDLVCLYNPQNKKGISPKLQRK